MYGSGPAVRPTIVAAARSAVKHRGAVHAVLRAGGVARGVG